MSTLPVIYHSFLSLCLPFKQKYTLPNVLEKNNRSNKLIIKTTSTESTQHAYPCSLLRYWISTWLGNLIKVDEYWFRLKTHWVTENPEVIHLLEHFLNLENLTGLRNQLKFTHDQLVDSDCRNLVMPDLEHSTLQFKMDRTCSNAEQWWMDKEIIRPQKLKVTQRLPRCWIDDLKRTEKFGSL